MYNIENNQNQDEHLINEEEYPSKEELNNINQVKSNDDYFPPPPSIQQSLGINQSNINPQIVPQEVEYNKPTAEKIEVNSLQYQNNNIEEINKPSIIPISTQNIDNYPYPPPNNINIVQPTAMPNNPTVVPVESVNQVQPYTQVEPIVQVQPVAQIQPIVQTQPIVQAQPVVQAVPVVDVKPVIEVKPAIVYQKQSIYHNISNYGSRHRNRNLNDDDCENCLQIFQCLCICLYCLALLGGGR